MPQTIYEGEQQPVDADNGKFVGVRVLSAGSGIFVAQAGANLRQEDGESVADTRVQVGGEEGLGQAVGGQEDTAATTDTGTFSLMSLFKRLLSNLSSVLGATTDAPVYDDVADASVQARLRGMVDHLGGLIATTGTTTAAAVSTDADGTLSGKLRGLIVLLVNLLSRWPAALTGSGNLKAALLEALPAGTNNIGDVDVLSLPALPAGTNNIGDVDVLSLPNVTIGAALPAGTNNIGDVDVLSLPNVTIGAALPAGTNNIGDVDVLSLPALPAGTNNIGDVDVLTLPGTVAVDITAIKTATERGATSAFATPVSIATAATLIKAAAATRKKLYVKNSSASSSPVYLGPDNTVTAGSAGKNVEVLYPGDAWEELSYTGTLYGICDTGGTASVKYLEVTT